MLAIDKIDYDKIMETDLFNQGFLANSLTRRII